MPLQIVSPPETSTLTTLLYGPPGTGKTVGACSAPGPVLIVNADRPNATRFAHRRFGGGLREVRMEGLGTLVDVVDHLQSESNVRTVVVDSVGECHRILLEEFSRRAIRPKLQDYGDATTHLERFCRALCDLPLNVVLVCHETSVKDEETGGHERLPWTGTTNPALGAKLMAMVDIVAYTGVVPPVKEDDAPRFMGQLISAQGRRGKDRTGLLGVARELDLSEWVATAHPTPKSSANGRKVKKEVAA